eukprot:5987491-Alexandrium_andersonii.AAC.1
MLAGLRPRGRLFVQEGLLEPLPLTACALCAISAAEWIHIVAYGKHCGLFECSDAARFTVMTVVGLLLLYGCCLAAAGP